MPGVITGIFTASPGQRILFNIGVSTPVTNVGVAIVQGGFGSVRYRGFLSIAVTQAGSGFSYIFVTSAGSVWNNFQQFTLPPQSNAQFIFFDQSKRISTAQGVRFYYFTP